MASNPAVDPVERLVAIEAIKQLKARYCRFADSKQWDAFRALFTDEATFECPDMGFATKDPDELIERVSSAFVGNITMHHCHNPEIELTSSDEAVGVWAMEDRGASASGVSRLYQGYGHYHERYVKRDNAWLISDIRLVYVRQELPVANELPR